LACVDFETAHPAVGVARKQRARQAGGAAAELDDFAARQRHQVRQKIKFVVNQWQGFDGANASPSGALRLGAAAGAHLRGAAAYVPEVWRRDEDRGPSQICM